LKVMAKGVKVVEFDEALRIAEFVVEASSFERQALWEGWAKDASGLSGVSVRPNRDRIDWRDQSRGWLEQVGELDARPVNISLSIAWLNGHPVLFYEAVSQVVDWKRIEAWFRERCWPLWDNGTRRAHCDAMNFHHCLEVCHDGSTTNDNRSR
jgi:hypothetical protein